MVVGVEMAGGNLHASAEGQAGAGLFVAGVQSQFADEDAGSDELLNLAVVGAAIEESGIALQLWPEDFVELPLRSRVPYDWSAGSVGGGVAGGQRGADGGLHIEAAESLADAQVGLHAAVGGSVFGLAGGHCCQSPKTDYVRAVLGIAACNTIFGDLHYKLFEIIYTYRPSRS